MIDRNSRLVYSTDTPVPKKGQPSKVDSRIAARPARSGPIVRLERQGRGGKTVTLIEGIPASGQDGEKILKQLKTKLGTGGTARGGLLEIQGDHRDAVIVELAGMGYKPKRSGG